jgi:hypothetical protein
MWVVVLSLLRTGEERHCHLVRMWSLQSIQVDFNMGQCTIFCIIVCLEFDVTCVSLKVSGKIQQPPLRKSVGEGGG